MDILHVLRTSLAMVLLLIAILAVPAGAMVYDTGMYGSVPGDSVPSVVKGDTLSLPHRIIVEAPTYHLPRGVPKSWKTPLLKPGCLPEGCAYTGMEFLEGPGVVSLEYTCVSIQEGKAPSVGVGLWGVPDDKMERVLIGGRTGYYIDGMWMRPDGEDHLVWMQGPKQLVFEKDGTTVHIFSKNEAITKQQMIEIAASLKAVSN